MGVLLYNLTTSAYFSAIKIAAIFNGKARRWVAGRKNLWGKLESHPYRPGSQTIWMHCASHGEFEQGRPLLEALRTHFPSAKIILTFFSPSGMEHAAWKDLTDDAWYLPADSSSNAQRFLDLVQPSLALFVKYELWYHYLAQLQRRGIPTVLVAANFRKEQIFFRWYGGLYRQMLGYFNLILVQYPECGKLLEKIGIRHYKQCGDPRFDRAVQLAQTPFENPVLQAFCEEKKVLIAGSTWPADERVLLGAFSSPSLQNWKLVLVPHEVHQKRIETIKAEHPGTAFYSSLEQHPPAAKAARVLILDKMGLLSRIYRYGTDAYVGGAMGNSGLHNIIEPVAYKLPILFGKKHGKYPEAGEMIQCGVAYAISGPEDLTETLNRLTSAAVQTQIKAKATAVLHNNEGVTQRMLKALLSGEVWTNKKADFQ